VWPGSIYTTSHYGAASKHRQARQIEAKLRTECIPVPLSRAVATALVDSGAWLRSMYELIKVG